MSSINPPQPVPADEAAAIEQAVALAVQAGSEEGRDATAPSGWTDFNLSLAVRLPTGLARAALIRRGALRGLRAR